MQTRLAYLGMTSHMTETAEE